MGGISSDGDVAKEGAGSRGSRGVKVEGGIWDEGVHVGEKGETSWSHALGISAPDAGRVTDSISRTLTIHQVLFGGCLINPYNYPER